MTLIDAPRDPLKKSNRPPNVSHARRRKAAARKSLEVGADESDYDTVVVVRESSDYDRQLFLQMIEQTLQPRAGTNDDCARALKLGLRPITDEELRTELGVMRLSYSGKEIFGEDSTRVCAHRFAIGKTIFLYSMSSAGKTNAEDSNYGKVNAVTRILCDTLEEYRPKTLVAGSISRLLRSTRHGERLEEVVLELNVFIETNEFGEPLNLREPEDKRRFEMLASMAAWERDQILLRTTMGRVLQARGGDFSSPSNNAPYGFMRTEDKKLALSDDPKEIEFVRLGLRLLAQNLPIRQVAKLLIAEGVKTRGLAEKKGPDKATLDSSKRPENIVSNLLSWAYVYRDDEWLREMAVPFRPKETKFAGLPVQIEEGSSETDREPTAYVLVPVRMPSPKGGWGTRADLEAAASRHENRSHVTRLGRSRKNQRYPLCGVVKRENEGHHWYLRSEGLVYRVGRVPIGADSEKPTRVASARASSLHRDIAERAREVVRKGIPAAPGLARRYEAETLPYIARQRGQLLELQVQEKRARQRYEGAVGLQAEAKGKHADGETLAALDKTAAGALKELNDLKQAAEQISSAITQPPKPPATIGVDLDVFLVSLEALEISGEHPKQGFLDAIESILYDLCFDVDEAWVRWSIMVRFVASFDVAELGFIPFGPINGRVPNCRSVSNEPAYLDARHRLWLSEAMSEGLSASEMSQRVELSKQVVRAALISQLAAHVPAVRARTAIIDSDLPGTRIALWAAFGNGSLPEEASPNFTDYLKSVYVEPSFSWRGASELTRQRASAVAAVARAGGWLSAPQLQAEVGLSRDKYYRMFVELLRDTDGALSPIPPCLAHEDRDEPGARLVGCGHCGNAVARVVDHAEVPGLLLCDNCRKMPFVPDSPEFPDWYFSQTADPAAGSGPDFRRA